MSNCDDEDYDDEVEEQEDEEQEENPFSLEGGDKWFFLFAGLVGGFVISSILNSNVNSSPSNNAAIVAGTRG
jgi:hypothetical protein